MDPVHPKSSNEAGNAATWQATGHYCIPPSLLDDRGLGSPVEGLVEGKWQGKAARLAFHDVLQMAKVGKGSIVNGVGFVYRCCIANLGFAFLLLLLGGRG